MSALDVTLGAAFNLRVKLNYLMLLVVIILITSK